MVSVAFIVPEMLPVPPVEGGAVEGWVHEVSGALAMRGFEVSVISRPAPPDANFSHAVEYHGIPWSPAGRRWYLRRRRWSRLNPLRPLVKIANVLEYGLGVRRKISQLQPDVVYVHNDPWLLAMLDRDAARATLLHLHNDHLSARWARPLLAGMVARCDRVLCVSDHVRDRTQLTYPAHARRIVTLLNAIAEPPGVFDANVEPASFLFAGRLVPEKGVDVLLEAFRHLLEERPQARLTIAGSSFFAKAPPTAYERTLRERAASLGDRVRFIGFVPRDQLWSLYRRASAVVVPSTWAEPFGLVAIEAMACGTPVIVSRAGGLPEIVSNGRTGVVVPPGDVRALVHALRAAVDRPADMQQLGRAARDEVRARFALSRMVGEIEACLRAEAVGSAARMAVLAFASSRQAPAFPASKEKQ